MSDFVRTKTITVTIQENGIIRNARGRMIARLLDGVCFDTPVLSDAPVFLSPWITDGHCAFRHIYGTDPDKVCNRVAFIEKTPRVRDRSWNALDSDRQDHLNWISGPKGTGCSSDEDPEEKQAYGFDPESRNWCDKQLAEFGYILNPPT